jgi:hypothetical protein
MLGDQLHFVVSHLLGQGETHGSEGDARVAQENGHKE